MFGIVSPIALVVANPPWPLVFMTTSRYWPSRIFQLIAAAVRVELAWATQNRCVVGGAAFSRPLWLVPVIEYRVDVEVGDLLGGYTGEVMVDVRRSADTDEHTSGALNRGG